MPGRIPMKGDPKPLDREAMARELASSLERMRADSERHLEDAEAADDQEQVEGHRQVLAKIEKLERG